LKYGLDTLENYPAGIALNTLIAELVAGYPKRIVTGLRCGEIFSLASSPRQNANGDSQTQAETVGLSRQPVDQHKTTSDAA
jgi:hypothetical protein